MGDASGARLKYPSGIFGSNMENRIFVGGKMQKENCYVVVAGTFR